MEQDRIPQAEPARFHLTFAKAGMWFLLMFGLLAVCVSLPMMALAF